VSKKKTATKKARHSNQNEAKIKKKRQNTLKKSSRGGEKKGKLFLGQQKFGRAQHAKGRDRDNECGGKRLPIYAQEERGGIKPFCHRSREEWQAGTSSVDTTSTR